MGSVRKRQERECCFRRKRCFASMTSRSRESVCGAGGVATLCRLKNPYTQAGLRIIELSRTSNGVGQSS
jgi:hypothetical protein